MPSSAPREPSLCLQLPPTAAKCQRRVQKRPEGSQASPRAGRNVEKRASRSTHGRRASRSLPAPYCHDRTSQRHGCSTARKRVPKTQDHLRRQASHATVSARSRHQFLVHTYDATSPLDTATTAQARPRTRRQSARASQPVPLASGTACEPPSPDVLSPLNVPARSVLGPPQRPFLEPARLPMSDVSSSSCHELCH